uniref:2Fe-2S ferredoxin-type domain-containing protein n=1 Tax=Pseudictyota dubia TaxID=2749911 RepID=A0A7R9VKD2_9STRA|mmetsp:Transcript_16827/g.31484  ORF Transcript_16827/g.31484 Transcript_16827/m.31484 type:complete len:138 (+) Transcript_16827:126-539(+)|eukprot:CAMPEP_0197444748 /NCGR_PEP_ID=MMETSP1175-20131217/10152_1 /TAXON_ID=1003142 /ORGANISM="Triceratium dubium, Strain CCMP147" /LENGTH=137 /DNA_ID=CAMNT_0042975591 /DNA_START=113 /DNA_END=526 /DNA_ORIENTATION=+
MYSSHIFALSVAVAFLLSTVNAFAGISSVPLISKQGTSLNIFGKAFSDAFANEDVGEKQNAGLTGGPRTNENVSVNGKAVSAVVGQKVSVVAAAARVKIPYNCRNGDCGTCTVKMNNRKVKACQATIPAGNCRIETI